MVRFHLEVFCPFLQMGITAGAYFALFIVLFAIAEVVTETLGGKFAASGAPRCFLQFPCFLNHVQSAGVLQIIVALISAGTGVTLVNLWASFHLLLEA
jgi:hypothetical protein